jgi:hypothetical protein
MARGMGALVEVPRAAHRLRGVGGTGRRSPQSHTGWGELGALAEDCKGGVCPRRGIIVTVPLREL